MVDLMQVLALPSLALTPIKVVDASVRVRWVATSELPDPTPFLDGGEVLLTLGLSTVGWEDEWSVYTERLSSIGIVALGFGIGFTYESVPSALIAAAAEAGLALFSIPRSTPFIAISQAVAELLSEAENGALQLALTVQRDLTRAATRPDGVQGVLDALAGAIGGGAAVMSPRGDPSVVDAVTGLREETLAAVTGQIETMRPAGLRASLADIGPTGSTVIQPLGFRGAPDRYLVVETAGELSAAGRSAVTTAVALLSLDAESRAERLEFDRRLHTGAVALILNGQASAASAILSIGANRTAVRLPTRIQVCRAAGPFDKLERALDRLGRDRGPRSPAVVALVAAGGPKTAEARSELVCVVGATGSRVERVERSLLEEGLRVGTGGVVELTDAAGSDATAAQGLAQTSQLRPLVRWSDLAAGGVTSALNPGAALVFAAETLGVLADEDRAGLLETVRVFLEHHGQRKPTAVALGLHRNTLALRIAQVERLLARSLADPQTRVDLWVAIQVHSGATGHGPIPG